MCACPARTECVSRTERVLELREEMAIDGSQGMPNIDLRSHVYEEEWSQ